MLTLTGCTGNLTGNQASPIKENFSTKITNDGTKLFIYRLELPPLGKGEINTRYYERSGLPKPGYFERNIAKKIDARLKQKIASTRFCTTGYIVLERYVGKSSASIRGECKEGFREN